MTEMRSGALQLVIQTGPRSGQVFPMEDRPIRIGRDPDSTIRLDDTRSSRNHTILEPTEDGSWVCRDLQSTNQTFLNGKPVVTAVLKDGDVICIGSTEMRLDCVRTSSTSSEKGTALGEIAVDMNQQSLEMALRSTSEVSSGRASMQESLFRIGLLNNNSTPHKKFLSEALKCVRDCVNFSMWIWVEWPDGLDDNPVIHGGGVSGGFRSENWLVGNALVARAARHQTGIIGNPGDVKYAQESGRTRVHSNLAIPLINGDRVHAVLYVDREGPNAGFRKDELEAIAALASHIHVGVKNIDLFQQLESAFEELNQSQSELVRSEKLAAIGRLSSGFAHDLNNPLSSVIGFLDLATRAIVTGGTPVPDKLEHYLSRARDAADYCRALSRNLLAFARHDGRSAIQGSDEGISYDAAKTIEATINICHASLQAANASIELNVEPGIELHGDPTSLQQVVLNLVTNAADALSERGRSEDNRIEIRGRRTDSGIEIEVVDNGPGIPHEIQERIFEPLFTTKPHDRGTGLGLFVVRRIVEESGGTLNVDSEPGQGTTFRVLLPVTVRSLSDSEPLDMPTLMDLQLDHES